MELKHITNSALPMRMSGEQSNRELAQSHGAYYRLIKLLIC
jgi:hypothetical protein